MGYEANSIISPEDNIPIYFLRKTYDDLSWNGFVESVQSFINAVDWSQPWLWTLLGFHVITLFTIFKLRNNTTSLAVITFGSMLFVGLAKPINTLAHDNWQKFSIDNYFDKSGFFISMVFSFPLLCNSMFGIVLILNEVLHLLRKVKIAQIKHQRAKVSLLEEKRKEKQDDKKLKNK
ncbi:8875_t:CDS:2 [Funneliformis mosseae]|uniref:8875_t:CDS:1 n=1 Tax=Funneliformis mosseae TaxID=27381 RepID=A0A9N8W235_FUNMO|nr:8875_t:CDS:2 [Funneliformis mosseae]